MAQTCETLVPATTGNVCNAGYAGFVALDRVLTVLNRQESTVRNLQVFGGLSASAETSFKRERFEITQGKLMLLDELKKELSALPASPNLTGEKPSEFLADLEARRVKARVAYTSFTKRVLNPTEPRRRFCEIQAAENDARACLLAELISTLSGSAEEQPLTSEEARPVTGNIPVTPGGPTLSLFVPPSDSGRTIDLASLSVKQLEMLTEAALNEYERRGGVTHWSLTAV